MGDEPTRKDRGVVRAAGSLARRELVRFFRQRSRVVSALATPLLFWLVIGSGFNYLGYLFPGTLVQILLFASIFSTISIIQDRNEGFLQGVLVAPVPRAAIVLGKVLGGTAIALLQALPFLALGPLVGVRPSPAGLAATAGTLAVLGFGLTSLGTFFAWRFQSVQGFHGIMNLILIPMWLLSGAVFPPEGAVGWVRGVMAANPLTYGVEAVRRSLEAGAPTGASIAVTALFAAAMFGLAAVSARGKMGPG
jgi:ABC-2 type transport system permease protein